MTLSSTNGTLRFLLGLVVPHSLVTLRHRARLKQIDAQSELRQRRALEADTFLQPYSYEDSIAHLIACGLTESEVRDGSVTESSLRYIEQHLPQPPSGQPLRVLHVGNFVGVSLCYLAAACCRLHPDSLVVAIDPNIRHRGIPNPQQYVSRLLKRYGLQKNVIMICGFSESRNLGDDGGLRYSAVDDALQRFNEEHAPENVLHNLSQLLPPAFDAAMLDGNHSETYLNSEIGGTLNLLKPGGRLIFDDVNSSWPGIQRIFSQWRNAREIETSITDGRVGILNTHA